MGEVVTKQSWAMSFWSLETVAADLSNEKEDLIVAFVRGTRMLPVEHWVQLYSSNQVFQSYCLLLPTACSGDSWGTTSPSTIIL